MQNQIELNRKIIEDYLAPHENKIEFVKKDCFTEISTFVKIFKKKL